MDSKTTLRLEQVDVPYLPTCYMCGSDLSTRSFSPEQYRDAYRLTVRRSTDMEWPVSAILSCAVLLGALLLCLFW